MPLSRDLPDLVTTAALRRVGETAKELERAVRAGSAVRVRRGAYLGSEEWTGRSDMDRHLLLVLAGQAAAGERLVFSHESAAALLGIPIIGRWPKSPHATAPLGSGRRSTASVIWHTAQLDDEVIDTGDALITSPLRTLIDLMSSRPFLSGVVSAEHVLHRHREYAISKEQLIDEIEDRRPFRNVNRAAAVARFATGSSESPGESLSMVRFFEGGYPRPVQQKSFIGVDGREYFPDFYFPAADAIGESDGWAKYEDLTFLAGRTAAQAFRDEKRREDALRPLVAAFVRWDWDEAWAVRPLYRKLDSARIRRLPKK